MVLNVAVLSTLMKDALIRDRWARCVKNLNGSTKCYATSRARVRVNQPLP